MFAGLPVQMTTPAHGTAFDISGTNATSVDPTKNAFMMCCNMAERLAKASGWYESAKDVQNYKMPSKAITQTQEINYDF